MPWPNKPFKDWDRSELDNLVADPPAAENAHRDFKLECELLSPKEAVKKKARKDILKDISAMANRDGGALLIGIRQCTKKGAAPSAAEIKGTKYNPERLKQAIESIVNTHLDIRPAPLRYYPIEHEGGRSVLVVEISANTYSLSMITYEGMNQFWVRRGTDNCLMTTDEIEYRFNRFAKVHDLAEEELKSIVLQFGESTIKPMVWFAGVPIARSIDHIPVRQDIIRGIFLKSSYFATYSSRRALTGFTPYRYEHDIVPCVRGFRLSPEAQGRVALEIRRDGVLVFGFGLALTSPNAPKSLNSEKKEENRRELRVTGLPNIYEPIASALHLFSDMQNHFELAKLSIVQAGLMDVQNVFIDSGFFFDPYRASKFHEKDVPLDPILADESWTPKEVFSRWVRQIANALVKEEPLVCPPWIGPDKEV